jgi:hypothetical protein
MTEKDSGSDSEHPTSPASTPAPRSFPLAKRLTLSPTMVASLLVSLVITALFLAAGGSSGQGYSKEGKTNDPTGGGGKISSPVLNAAIRSKQAKTSGGKVVEPAADTDDVKPHQPYRPRLKGWSKKLLRESPPSAEGSEPLDTSCVAWRQTSRCDPNGPREPFFDVMCNITITSNKGSGYCDCGAKGRKAMFGCGFHRDFLCSDVCDVEGYLEKLMEGANLEPDRADGDGGEADAGFGDDGVVDDIKLGQQGYEPARSKISPTPVDQFAGLYLSPELRRALDSRQPDPSYCVGWRQTSGCTPTGALDPSFDRPCNLPILNGMSGYCECKGRSKGKGPGVHCQHRPFRCVEQCDPAFKLESVLHPLALSSFEDHDTGDKTFPVVTKFDYRNSNDLIEDGSSGVATADRFYQRETEAERQLQEPLRLKKLTLEMRHLVDVSLFKRAMTSWFSGIGGSVDDELMEQIGVDEAAHKHDPADLSWWTGLHTPQLTAFDADVKSQIEKAKLREQEKENERATAKREQEEERPSLKDTEPGKALALRQIGQLNHQRNLQSSLIERMEAQKAERLLDEKLSEVEPVDKDALRVAERLPERERIEQLRQEEARLRAQEVVGEFQRHQLNTGNRVEGPIDSIPGEGTPGFVPEAEEGLRHHRQVRSQEAAQLLERYRGESQLRRHQR